MKIMTIEHNGWDEERWDRIIGYFENENDAQEVRKQFNTAAEERDAETCKTILAGLLGYEIRNLPGDLEFDNPRDYHIELQEVRDLDKRLSFIAHGETSSQKEMVELNIIDNEKSEKVRAYFVDYNSAIKFAANLPESRYAIWLAYVTPDKQGRFIIDGNRTVTIQ